VKNLLGVSAFLIAAFGALEAMGWRSAVVLLCDIMKLATPWESFTFGLYVAFYIGAYVFAPALVLAAAALALHGMRDSRKVAGADGMSDV
jgi:hypothetical protein